MMSPSIDLQLSQHIGPRPKSKASNIPNSTLKHEKSEQQQRRVRNLTYTSLNPPSMANEWDGDGNGEEYTHREIPQPVDLVGRKAKFFHHCKLYSAWGGNVYRRVNAPAGSMGPNHGHAIVPTLFNKI